MKRFFTFFLTFLLAFSFCLPAYGLTNPELGDDPAENAPIILTGTPADLQKKIIIIEETETLTASHFASMPWYPYLDSSGNILPLSVEWHISEDTLLSPGLHEVTATPVLSAGTELAEGYDGIVTWPIFRKGGDAKLELISLNMPVLSSPLMPLQGDPKTELSLQDIPNNCITEGGYSFNMGNDSLLQWVWDTSAVDASKLGKYTIQAHLQYPDWINVPENFCSTTADIYVLPPDRIEIYAPVSLSLNGILDIRWLYDSDHITDPVLEQKTAGDTWEACDESWGGYLSSVYTSDHLQLRLAAMPKDVPLTLRLRYSDVVEGETVTRTTEAISLTVPADILEQLAAGKDEISIQVIEGDRDGSDSQGTPLPDQTQPAPSRRKKKKQATKVVTEVVTDTYSAISGLRVNTLADNGSTVLFEKQKVSAEIPSKLLKNLNLKDQDLLEIILLRPDETTAVVALYAKGKLVEDISGTTVFLPWDAKNGTSIQCVDLWGYPVSSASYDEKSRTLRFTVPTPNTYFLKKTPSHHPSPYADKGGIL